MRWRSICFPYGRYSLIAQFDHFPVKHKTPQKHRSDLVPLYIPGCAGSIYAKETRKMAGISCHMRYRW
jgi:hypothetical protein